MGKGRLIIKRLESMKARQAKYSKRKVGLLKKAKQLSILCDVDLALLMFSPTAGRPTSYVGQDKELSTVLERLSGMQIEEREERRAYTMKSLKKIYEKGKSDVDSTTFTQVRNDDAPKVYAPSLEAQFLEARAKLDKLKEMVAERRQLLSEWRDPSTVTDPAKLRMMEQIVLANLTRVRMEKSRLLEQQREYEASQLTAAESDFLQPTEETAANLGPSSSSMPELL